MPIESTTPAPANQTPEFYRADEAEILLRMIRWGTIAVAIGFFDSVRSKTARGIGLSTSTSCTFVSRLVTVPDGVS